MNKEEIIKQYADGIVNVDEVIEYLIDKFKIDKFSVDIQQARLIIDYLLANRESDEDYIDEEKEYIEHEIVDRLYCLREEDFDKTKVDDSYIQAVIKAGKENKKLIDKLQKELDKYKRLAEANLKDSQEFQDNMCNHRCIKNNEVLELKEELEHKQETIDKIMKELEEFYKKYDVVSKDKIRELKQKLLEEGHNLTEEQRQKETEFRQGKLKAYEELLGE